MVTQPSLPEVSQFITVLGDAPLDSRAIDQAAKNVARLIREYELRPTNRSKSRVLKQDRTKVRKTPHTKHSPRNTPLTVLLRGTRLEVSLDLLVVAKTLRN